MTNKRRGISLIVLVITIIVIIILAGAVILSLADSNPIASANKAVFLSDISNFKSAVALDYASQVAGTTTGAVTYVEGSAVTALRGKLFGTGKKYAWLSVTTTGGAVVFSGTVPAGLDITLDQIN
jgi:hypothetical protein